MVDAPSRTLREGLRHCQQMPCAFACGDGRSGAIVPSYATHMPQSPGAAPPDLPYVLMTCGRYARPGKKIFTSRSADSSESEAWIRFSRTMTPKSPRMEPGAAAIGSVGPAS